MRPGDQNIEELRRKFSEAEEKVKKSLTITINPRLKGDL